MRRIRIAWFSPELKYKEESPAAYITSLLLPKLRNFFEIDLYTNSLEASEENEHHYLRASAKHREKAYDLFLYNLEDRPYSQFIRVHSTLIPGINWYHNYVFSTFGPEPILNSTWQATVAKFNKTSRPWGDLYTENPQEGPAAKREDAFALACICSNPAILETLKANNLRLDNGEREVVFIPYPVDLKNLQTKSSTNRSKEFSLALCSAPLIESRTHKIMQALSELDFKYQLNWLIKSEDKPAAEKILAEFGIVNYNLIEGRSLASWLSVVASSDCVLHLLYSAYSQLDQYFAASLVLGKPTLVSDFGLSDYLSNDHLFKIQTGSTEALEIKEVLSALANKEVEFNSKALKEYASDLFDLDIIVAELSNFLNSQVPKQAKTIAEWSDFQTLAKQSLVSEVLKRHSGATKKLEALVFNPVFEEFGWK